MLPIQMLITLLGPDRYTVGVALKSHLEKHSSDSPGMEGFNTSVLDGAKLMPDELERAVQSLGFFGDRRVVVVEGLLSRVAGKGGDSADSSPDDKAESMPKGRGKADPALQDGFARILSQVPESTVLILVERGGVAKNSTLVKVAQRYGKVEEYIPPKGTALERWIANRGTEIGVKVNQPAQVALANALPDLQTLANELDKLALYVGQGGTIDERALREMSFASKQDDVFELTSAVANRDTRRALLQLGKLLDGGTAPEGILPVLAWQVRTLIQVRDMLDRRVPEPYMAEQAGLSDFVVRKTAQQARQFTMPKLRDIHSKLLDLDHAVKTGRAEAELSIDALVVEMCRA